MRTSFRPNFKQSLLIGTSIAAFIAAPAMAQYGSLGAGASANFIQITPVPEPSTLVLLGSALIGAVRLRKKKKD